MTRSKWLTVVACLVGVGLSGWSGRASAEPSPIATSMGDLRWGMSENEVVAFLKRKLAERSAEQIGKTHDAHRQSQLRDDLKRAQSEVQKSQVSFEGGHSSRWDGSAIAGEFTYGNNESMVVNKDEASENYYFFINGRLWKWYKALGESAFGGANFGKFSQTIEKRFGKGHLKKGELSPGQGQTQWVEYLDRNSRMRAADNTRRGVFALIFEEMSTVHDLASLRGTTPTRPTRNSYAQADDAQDSAQSSKSRSGRTELAKASGKRSVFAAEAQHEESDAEYRERIKRDVAADKQRQQNMHARKQEANKGEALKPLEGLDDKDPLGGL